ncbi:MULTISPECIES: hypothetical protein [unclassified Methylobacterium]|uniref:hypothetical protein n=1 Tax=unclassified Methylobacterium TaxID=2615210 RepID=UPI0011C1D4B7|nr:MULTISPECIES: hypothetical protein [unclassified Methylobacterium]QEE39828.1 hypothetical protein FVA80_13565 [Methylobacterium sp. WL1]TXN57328.1 hypothetical protein FV241_11745 [Methylobacterium sp. WL2]
MTQIATHLSNFGGLIANGWAAFSLAAALTGIGGIGLILLGLLTTAYLPAWMRRPLIGAGILLIAGAALFQAGQARGAHEVFALQAARNLEEANRQAAAAAKISAADRVRADKADVAAKASASRFRDLQRHLARTPDGACATDDDARRLRDL